MTASDSERLRGVNDTDLLYLPDPKLIMLALGVLMGAYGVQDEALINMLLRRGKP